MTKRTEVQMLTEFFEGINIAEGAATQMVSNMQNPKFMAIRDMLNMVKDRITAKAINQSC